MTWELRHGDCLDPSTGMADMLTASVDVVITDPPYEAEAHTLLRRVKRGAVMAVEPLRFPPMTAETRDASAKEMARIAKRWILVFCQIEAAMEWRRALEAGGAVYRRTCIWVKPDGMPQYSGDRPGMGYETIVACHAPGISRWNGGGAHGVFSFNKNDADRSGHPTQKPDALMHRLVRLFSDRGDLVCDPFAGSGTTGLAAIREGRRFLGWEIDPEFHGAASRRLGNAREQAELAL